MSSPATAANDAAPGGLSAAHFKAICADAGQWLWGTVRGAFNEKASLTQIIVDAVIGMIPLVGDVTAVRDLIAVVMGLIDQPEKREKVWEWVLLVVLLFALIPVLGGVIKGVGRLVIKAAREAEVLVGAARAAHLGDAVRDIIAFLNRVGWKNAEAWFKALRVGEYQAQLLERFNKLMDVISGVLVQVQRKAGNLLPASLANRIQALKRGLTTLKELGAEMIPKAVKELDQKLRELQAFVHAGGQTTSRVVAHEVATGERVVTRAEEARLVESAPLPARSAKGWKKNEAVADDPKTYQRVYKHEPGYPDMRVPDEKTGQLTRIEAYSGRMINRELKEGEQIVRLFGPAGTTHSTPINQSWAGGAWWWLGAAPKTAKEWRKRAAVLDEFNRDGFMVVASVTDTAKLNAVVGTVSEQVGQKIPGQHLEGGGAQAFFYLDRAVGDAISKVGEQVMREGKAASWIDAVSGMKFEIKPTGWKDANGIWGYLHMPGQGSVQAARVEAREQATKENREVFK